MASPWAQTTHDDPFSGHNLNTNNQPMSAGPSSSFSARLTNSAPLSLQSSPSSTSRFRQSSLVFPANQNSPTMTSQSSADSSIPTPGTNDVWPSFMFDHAHNSCQATPSNSIGDHCSSLGPPGKGDCHYPPTSSPRMNWMEILNGHTPGHNTANILGNDFDGDCDKCEPSQSAATPRPSHAHCPPPEPCPDDACNHLSHEAVTAALAACCELSHLTSPTHCTTAAPPTQCCPDMAAHPSTSTNSSSSSSPSCDPCTIVPSACSEVTCTDASCSGDASMHGGHCGPTCDGSTDGNNINATPSATTANASAASTICHSHHHGADTPLYESFAELVSPRGEISLTRLQKLTEHPGTPLLHSSIVGFAPMDASTRAAPIATTAQAAMPLPSRPMHV